MLRICLNWKVLAGLATVAVGVRAYRPDLLGNALPILLLAVCPLWMMRGMNHGEHAGFIPPPPTLPDDPASLRARMTVLAAEQERVSEQLARLTTPPIPPPSDDDGPRGHYTA